MSGDSLELIGILIALALLIFLAFRGYTLLLAAPAAAIVAAAFTTLAGSPADFGKLIARRGYREVG
jgi:hypothetical protein